MWFVVRTKPRFEKKVESLLNALTLPTLAHPLRADALVQTVQRKWSDRIKKVDIPAITGYLFVQMADGVGPAQCLQLLTKIHYTPGVLRMLTRPGKSSFDPDGLAVVSDRELDIFRAAALQSGQSIVPPESDQPTITQGSLVRIISGPLSHLDATFIVDDIQNDNPTLLINEGLFQNARFTVSRDQLELVPKEEEGEFL